MSEKPTLADIAAMPLPASMLAMREHYDKSWGKYREEGELRTYKVKVRYSETISDDRIYTVEAASDEEAERLALDSFDKDSTVPADVDVDDVIADEVTA